MEIFSAEIVIAYRPNVIKGFGVDLAGTIGEDGVAQFNIIETGPEREEARISIAWVNPLEGCEVVRAHPRQRRLRTSNTSYLEIDVTLNEGVPHGRDDGRDVRDRHPGRRQRVRSGHGSSTHPLVLADGGRRAIETPRFGVSGSDGRHRRRVGQR